VRAWAAAALWAAALWVPGAARATDRAALDAADRAWASGDRRSARDGWRSAEGSHDPAVRAQAAVRMLWVSGNLGMAVHGPRADRALAVCPPSEPWCLLAEADYELLLAELGLPGDPTWAARAAGQAAPDLPREAAARLVWAGEAPLDALPQGPAVSEALARGAGRWAGGPGTWVLGLGMVGAPGLGVGATVRLLHPDLAWRAWRLEAGVAATSRRLLTGSVSLSTPGAVWARAHLAGGRRPFDVYDSTGARTTSLWRTAEAQIAPGLRSGRWELWAGPVARVDALDGPWLHGHGAAVGVARTAGPLRIALQTEGAAVDYAHVRSVGDLRWTPPAPGGTWAFWLRGEAAPLASSPTFRLPVAGGGQVLRSPPAGRFRAPGLVGAVAEWRSQPWGVLGVAAFVEGAWVHDAGSAAGDALHGGAGGGLRLHLPPRPHNTVRLDVAAGDAGWGLTAGWGEAF